MYFSWLDAVLVLQSLAISIAQVAAIPPGFAGRVVLQTNAESAVRAASVAHLKHAQVGSARRVVGAREGGMAAPQAGVGEEGQPPLDGGRCRVLVPTICMAFGPVRPMTLGL